jgi:hypothetical protein
MKKEGNNMQRRDLLKFSPLALTSTVGYAALAQSSQPRAADALFNVRSYGATPSNGFFIRHLKNLEMSHVEVAPASADPRLAFWLEDVHRADFFAITAPPLPNFALHNVSDLRILWSREAKDTTLAAAADQTL